MSIGAPVWLRSYDLDRDILNIIKDTISGAAKKTPRHVYVLASHDFAAGLREIVVPSGEDIFDDSDCYEEFFITAADFSRQLERLTENLAAAENGQQYHRRHGRSVPGSELIRYDYIIIPRLAEFALDAHRLLTLLKNRLSPTGVLFTAQLNADYRPILRDAVEGRHRFFDRHLYGRREITDLMYASFFKDVEIIPLGQSENDETGGKNNPFWLEICRPHTPIVTALKAGEKYPGENATVAALLRRMEYGIEEDSESTAIASMSPHRLALFVHSIIPRQHREPLLNKLYSRLSETAAAELQGYTDRLSADDPCDFSDFPEFSELSDDEELTGIPTPQIDGQPHIIAFVTCVNDEIRYSECRRYIEAIIMPKGWTARLLPIRGAGSMAEGYEAGRQMTRDAAIIVYLHQDVLVVNKKLTENLLSIFSASEKIGLVGVIGCRRLPETGIWWDGRRMVGQVLHACEPESIALAEHREPAPDRFLQGVEAVDGLFIAARGPGFPTASNPLADSVYDIPWRADIFDGWHFYDSSICREYRRRGLSVVIPRQGESFWCIHCPTEKPLDPAYHRYRQRFLREYGDELRPEV